MSPGSVLRPILIAVAIVSPSCDRSGAEDAPVPEDAAKLPPALADRIGALRDQLRDRPDAAFPRREMGLLYYANGLPDLALSVLEPLAADGDPMVNHLVGRLLEERADDERAAAFYDRAASAGGDVVPPLVRAALCRLRAGDERGAEERLERAMRAAPADPDPRVLLARLRLDQDRAEDAARLSREVLDEHPGEAFARRLLGLALIRLGRAEEGAAELRAAGDAPLEIRDPWHESAMRHRVGFHGTLDQAEARIRLGDAEGAISILEPLHEREPDDLTVVGRLLAAYVKAGRFDRAEDLVARARSRHPEHFLVSLDEAWLSYKRGRLDRALDLALEAARRNPNHAPALDLLATVHQALGDLDEAASAWREALRQGGSTNRRLSQLGRVEIGRGDFAAAADALGAAVSLDPSDAASLALLAGALAEIGDLAGAAHALGRAERLGADPARIAAIAARISELGGDE